MAEEKCAICGEFDEKDHFSCPNCSRDNLCGSHYNFDFLVCTECAEKMGAKTAKKAKPGAAKAAAAAEPEEEEVPRADPFYRQKVKCPVCGTQSEQRWFKAKLFSERNVDLDKHPGGYSWAEKGCDDFNPPLYYIWHCSNCHYADSYVEFENPTKDPYSNFVDLKEIFIDKYQDDPRIEKIIDKLGENIDYDKINYYQAIKLHFLAIFIQELIEDKEEQDAFRIGRYYLRLGWLYRELHDKKDENQKVIVTLEKLCGFLQKGWEEVAPDEKTALAKAVEYLNLAFRTSNSIKTVVAEIDMLLLIAGIQIKMEDTLGGLKGMNNVLTRGQKTKQKLEARLKDAEKGERPMQPDDIRRLETQGKRIDDLMGKARDVISDIKSEKAKEEKAKAMKIMKKLGERPPLEIRQILIKKGVDKNMAIKLTPEPKKKFLGLF
ncbi:MAG: DUF2225 domain-containing protein [bacterium]|nr:DUF2225 domain-containing protein [bacterium]